MKRMLGVLVVALVLVAVFHPADAGTRGAVCSEFPWSEGNPWRVLEVPPDQLADALWLVDVDPNLTLTGQMGAESTGCWAFVFRDSSQDGEASRGLRKLLAGKR